MTNKRHGRIEKGRTLPYGTLVDASQELRRAYYGYGYLHDHDMPELPCPPVDVLGAHVCPFEELSNKELIALVNAVLDTITPRERKVLQMRFGIGLSQDYTLEELGIVFDLTRERIRQIEAKAIRKLKHPDRNLMKMAFPEYFYQTTVSKSQQIKNIQEKWNAARAEAWARDYGRHP